MNKRILKLQSKSQTLSMHSIPQGQTPQIPNIFKIAGTEALATNSMHQQSLKSHNSNVVGALSNIQTSLTSQSNKSNQSQVIPNIMNPSGVSNFEQTQKDTYIHIEREKSSLINDLTRTLIDKSQVVDQTKLTEFEYKIDKLLGLAEALLLFKVNNTVETITETFKHILTIITQPPLKDQINMFLRDL